MSHTSTNILRDLSIQNHNLWLKVNLALSRFIERIKLVIPSGKINTTGAAAEIEAPADRFMAAVKRIEFKYGFEPQFSTQTPYGYFKGRHIIGENTRIANGIYISSSPAESIVMDEKYGVLNDIYQKLMNRISSLDEENSSYEYNVFSKVIALTRETLRYSEESVDNLRKHYNLQVDEKVSIDLYIKKKIGISRHQVLLAAFLLEKLREKHIIRGSFWIDPTVSEEVKNERLIFKNRDGEIFRFDPTKGLGKTAIH